jgi:phosphate starvation-inducible PhoH-like protein|tara:strand:+ start:2606 stop:3322 length:717 start_codon:yes stop_codon:yes gene_type:complete
MALKKLSSIQLEPHFHHSIKFKQRNFKFTTRQRRFLSTLLDPEVKIFFVSGPAGSSKTYMSLYGCLRLMAEDTEKELLYVRSIAESADKGLGSLPGDMAEKFNPFLMPLYDKLEEIVFEGDTAFLKQKGRISAVPINFLRGANWSNKLIVADEAQNFTFKELTTLVTRLGEDSKLIICGDFMQSDINGKTGFGEMFDLFSDEKSEKNGIHSFKFTRADIVRSKILKFIISKLETHKKV